MRLRVAEGGDPGADRRRVIQARCDAAAAAVVHNVSGGVAALR